MKIGMKKTVDVDVRTVSVHVKVRDEGFYTIKDQDGEVLYSEGGYVPGFFPGNHFGDYLILDIDLETGQILNWEAPTPATLANFIGDVE